MYMLCKFSSSQPVVSPDWQQGETCKAFPKSFGVLHMPPFPTDHTSAYLKCCTLSTGRAPTPRAILPVPTPPWFCYRGQLYPNPCMTSQWCLGQARFFNKTQIARSVSDSLHLQSNSLSPHNPHPHQRRAFVQPGYEIIPSQFPPSPLHAHTQARTRWGTAFDAADTVLHPDSRPPYSELVIFRSSSCTLPIPNPYHPTMSAIVPWIAREGKRKGKVMFQSQNSAFYFQNYLGSDCSIASSSFLPPPLGLLFSTSKLGRKGNSAPP